jgi:hypothetical protein
MFSFGLLDIYISPPKSVACFEKIRKLGPGRLMEN